MSRAVVEEQRSQPVGAHVGVALDGAGHAQRLTAEDESRGVDQVAPDVHECAAAELGPVANVRRVAIGVAERPEHRSHLADAAARHQVLDRQPLRMRADHERFLDFRSGAIADREELSRLIRRQRDAASRRARACRARPPESSTARAGDWAADCRRRRCCRRRAAPRTSRRLFAIPSFVAAARAFSRFREAIAVTSDHWPRCIAGMTFSIAILAAPSTPHRILRIAGDSILILVLWEGRRERVQHEEPKTTVTQRRDRGSQQQTELLAPRYARRGRHGVPRITSTSTLDQVLAILGTRADPSAGQGRRASSCSATASGRHRSLRSFVLPIQDTRDNSRTVALL